jgi:phage-related protein
MATFNWVPSYSSAVSHEPSASWAQFGDSYAQGVRSGINNDPESWDLVWNNVTKDIADGIDNFLKATGGVDPFFWISPDGDTPKQYICKKWSKTFNDSGSYNLTATFTEDFTP